MYAKSICVGIFEMRKSYSPNILRSGELGPCISVGIYDPVSESGYMIHEPYIILSNLEQRLEDIKEDYTDLSKLKVFACGNSLSSDDSNAQRTCEKGNRSYVEKTLGKYFSNSQLYIDWAPDDSICELILDLYYGEFLLKTKPDSEAV